MVKPDNEELEKLNKPLTEIEIAEIIEFFNSSALGKFGQIMTERVRRLAFQLDQMKWRLENKG